MTTDTITVPRGEMTLERAIQLIDNLEKVHKFYEAWGIIKEHLSRATPRQVSDEDGPVPSYWAAIGESLPDGSGGEIVLAYPANDGNGGEAARSECNQYINDVLLNDGVKLHLSPLYTRAALESLPHHAAKVPDGWKRNGEAALAEISNALDDLQYSPDQRPVPLLREAMEYIRAMLAAAPECKENV